MNRTWFQAMKCGFLIATQSAPCTPSTQRVLRQEPHEVGFVHVVSFVHGVPGGAAVLAAMVGLSAFVIGEGALDALGLI